MRTHVTEPPCLLEITFLFGPQAMKEGTLGLSGFLSFLTPEKLFEEGLRGII